MKKMLKSFTSCSMNILMSLKLEFRREKISLEHQPIDDFCKSQWQSSNRSLCWLIYRWSLALFFFIGVVSNMIEYWHSGLWFIYLTHWGFLMCFFTNLYGAIIATIFYYKPKFFAIRIIYMKIYWMLHISTLVLSIVISFMYWIFIYPGDKNDKMNLYNLWSHGFNSIVMILDQILVAFPTNLMHFVYPIGFGILYITFTLIYYIFGGVNTSGDPFIYHLLDWSKPGWAVLFVFISFILIGIFCFILFGLYKIRIILYRKCCTSQ